MYEHSIRFHLSTCLFLYKHCGVYIALALQYNLKLSMMATPGVYYYDIIIQGCFGYAVFMSTYEYENYHFYICEELCWKFDEDCIKSVDCFWKYGHFCYTYPAVPLVYNLFPSSDIFFSNYFFSDFNFLSYKFFTYLVRTIPSILCYLKLL